MLRIAEKTNLLDHFSKGRFHGIAHQCNLEGKMGKGIAKEIAKLYPEALSSLKLAVKNGDSLGTVNFAITNDGLIFNAIAQSLKGTGVKTDYKAFSQCFIKIKEIIHKLKSESFILGVPYGIGCGLGGGDWHIIYNILEAIFEKETNICLTICKLPQCQ